MEYVGEVLDYREFKRRTKQYDSQEHYYFMALNADEVIDATTMGNQSRFINHSCDPNCETQKVHNKSSWTVNIDFVSAVSQIRKPLAKYLKLRNRPNLYKLALFGTLLTCQYWADLDIK